MQTFPGTGRHLIDKTKDTPVTASGDAEWGEDESEGVVGVLPDDEPSGLAVLRVKSENDPFVCYQKTVIDNVMDFFSIHGVEDVPRF
jgi:hypothetical protein